MNKNKKLLGILYLNWTDNAHQQMAERMMYFKVNLVHTLQKAARTTKGIIIIVASHLSFSKHMAIRTEPFGCLGQ